MKTRYSIQLVLGIVALCLFSLGVAYVAATQWVPSHKESSPVSGTVIQQSAKQKNSELHLEFARAQSAIVKHVADQFAIEMVNGLSSSFSLEGVEITEQQYQLLDTRAIQYYNNLVQGQHFLRLQTLMHSNAFTNDEMREILAFTKTEAGKKWMSLQSQQQESIRSLLQAQAYSQMHEFLDVMQETLVQTEEFEQPDHLSAISTQ